jgi:dihydroxyacid dehydratase/phosphogluconate dehydratase
VTGETLSERLEHEGDEWVTAPYHRRAQETAGAHGGLALFGNLAPQGAILKRSAADANLFEHEGKAVVFSSLEDLAARIDDPNLDVDAKDILVLQNAGPHSVSAMPEAGYLPIPKKLASKGIKDMVRVSDARMSGTAFGTIVLHVTPDSASGGVLGLVRNGDRLRLSVKQKRIDLLVDDAELTRRAADQTRSAGACTRLLSPYAQKSSAPIKAAIRFPKPNRPAFPNHAETAHVHACAALTPLTVIVSKFNRTRELVVHNCKISATLSHCVHQIGASHVSRIGKFRDTTRLAIDCIRRPGRR